MSDALQFHGHHSYFRKDFPDAVSEYERGNIVVAACTRLHLAKTKQKMIISKIRKNCPLKSSYIAPCDKATNPPCPFLPFFSSSESFRFVKLCSFGMKTQDKFCK